MIKPIWDKYTAALSDFRAMLSEMNDGISDNRTRKAFNKMLDQWGKCTAMHNDIDRMIDPVNPLHVTLPFDDQEFAEIWVMYMEGLAEKHGETLTTRQQTIRLRRIKRFSDNNVKRAIAMLEFFIDNGYKGVFHPSEKQLTGAEPGNVQESGTLDLNKKGEL